MSAIDSKQNLIEAINNKQFDTALHIAEEVTAADIAEVIEDIEFSASTAHFLEQLPNRADIFGYLDVDMQMLFAKAFSRTHLAKLFSEMPADERADLFKQFDQEQRNTLLPALAQAEREDIRKLASYAEGTAGALMTSEYATLRKDMNVVEALAALRTEAPDAETINYAYVVDKNRKLVGVVSLRELIIANAGTLVNDLMSTDPVHCIVTDDQEEVAKKIARYDLFALPIVDYSGAIVGIVTHDDATDVMNEEATEDFYRSGAVSNTVGNLKDASIFLLYRTRIFWLVFLVFGSLLSGAGIHHFESIIEAHIVLVFFLPLLINSGGNAGTQSSTLMVRALATGEVEMKDWFNLLGREILVALCLGATMAAAITGIGIYRSGMILGVVLAFSMVSIVLIGCIIGLSLPFVLNKLKFDPANASAPLVTSMCDISGVVVYLFIATQFMQL